MATRKRTLVLRTQATLKNSNDRDDLLEYWIGHIVKDNTVIVESTTEDFKFLVDDLYMKGVKEFTVNVV